MAHALRLALVGFAGLTGMALGGGQAFAQEAGQTGQEGSLPTITVKGTAEGKADSGYRSKQSSIAGFGEQALIDTPFSVRVVPSELLLNQDVGNIGKLDRFDASVSSSASNPSWFAAPQIRGFSLDNWSNYRYNGQIMVNQQNTGLENKERVEVLKGLSALQGGFSAPGGLINYVTKRPGSRPITDLHFVVNQFGGAKVHADVSRRSEDGRVRVRVNAAAEQVQSYIHKVDGERTFGSVAFDWQLAPSTMLQLDVEHERNDVTLQPNLRLAAGNRLPANVDPRTFLGQTWASFPTESTLVSGKLEHWINESWSVAAEATWMRLERHQDSIALASSQANGNATAQVTYFQDQKREPGTVRLMTQGKFGTGSISHALTAGLQSHRFRVSGTASSAAIPLGTTNIWNPVTFAQPARVATVQVLTQRNEEDSIFVHDVMSFSDAWKVHLGGRYAHRTQDNAVRKQYDKNVFTPSVAVVFKPRANVSTYVSYIEGLEQGGTAPTGTNNPVNEQLTPKVSKQMEVGVKSEVTANLTAEAALFHIERPAEYTNAANFYVQDGKHQNQGLELSLAGKLTPEWTLLTSAMLLDAKLEKTGDVTTQGKRAANTPTHRLAAVTEYSPHALTGWTFSGNWTRVSRRHTNDANTGEVAPSYDVFGLGARYETKLGATPTTFRVNVDNLFDKFYWSSASSASLVPGATRTISASMSLRF